MDLLFDDNKVLNEVGRQYLYRRLKPARIDKQKGLTLA
jgi:hypothetical protein